MKKWLRSTLVPVLAVLAPLAILCSCGDKKPAPPSDSSPPPITQETPEVEYGAASIEDFQLKFRQAIGKKDAEAYRRLHHWDTVPAPQKTGLSNEGPLSHPIFKYSALEISTEPMTESDQKQISKDKWNIPPTHYLIAQGEDRGQFSTWEIGEFGGRVYIASRIK